jgi:hypothetical protein
MRDLSTMGLAELRPQRIQQIHDGAGILFLARELKRSLRAGFRRLELHFQSREPGLDNIHDPEPTLMVRSTVTGLRLCRV